MTDISGKRILFIGTGFYDYENDIVNNLNKRGCDVYYFSSVVNSWIKRFLVRCGFHKLSVSSVSNQIMKKLRKAPNDIDVIFVIKGENITRKHIDFINNKYINTRKILYLWDSIVRLDNGELLLNSFDKILTFDREDSVKYGILFRPLYFRNIESDSHEDILYDISFVGGMHSIRYKVIREIRKQLDKFNKTYKLILVTGKTSYFIERYLKHTITKEDAILFRTTPVKYDEYIRISRQSRIILDISNPLQSGLTMRTIESIGLGKKILTTNADIRNYSFPESNYNVLNLSNYKLDKAFFDRKKFVPYDSDRFSEKKFIDDIFE